MYYLNGDSGRTNETLADDSEAWLQTIVESENAETVKFYWKVSSEQDGDYLQFYVDETLKDQISGEDGDDCAWVDFVRLVHEKPGRRTPAQLPERTSGPGMQLELVP